MKRIKIYKTIQNFFKNYRSEDIDDINIDYENAKTILKNDEDAILLDVRSPQEYRETNLPRSINIPLYNLEEKAAKTIPNKQNIIIVYCQSGGRSKKACEILINMKYERVYNIKGGLDSI